MKRKEDPKKPRTLKEVKITAKPIVHTKDTMVTVKGNKARPDLTVVKSKLDSIVRKSSPEVKRYAKGWTGSASVGRQLTANRDSSKVSMKTGANTKNSASNDVMYGIAKKLQKKK